MSRKFEYQPYVAGQRVTEAQNALDQHQASRPQDYQSLWAPQRDQVFQQIQNREPFRYNANEDPLWQQAKEQYIRGGRLAMMDTMGQAAALTGGYGSSYAQQVGQQAFQSYLQGLNGKLGEYYQMARDNYDREGQNLKDLYGMLGDRDAEDYARWNDRLNLWLSDRNYLGDVARDARDYDINLYNNNRSFDYGQFRDEVADEQWQAQMDFQREQWEWQKAQAEAAASRRGGGGGGSGKPKYTYDDILAASKSIVDNPGKGSGYSDVLALQNEAVKAGVITSDEQKKMMRQTTDYREDRGHTPTAKEKSVNDILDKNFRRK